MNAREKIKSALDLTEEQMQKFEELGPNKGGK